MDDVKLLPKKNGVNEPGHRVTNLSIIGKKSRKNKRET